ncbi:hypothetical protein [Variovorax paradoxus]|uniref:hypothetical protein n=1 Tax=Variovorax paradoxus TaxID=34073 RepID=UPI003995A4B8
MNRLPPAWLLAGILAIGWLGGGLSAWLILRAGRKAPRVSRQPARPDVPVAERPAARVSRIPRPAEAAPPVPPPERPERRLLDLSDEEIDALPAELPAAERAQRRKLPGPRKPDLRNI